MFPWLSPVRSANVFYLNSWDVVLREVCGPWLRWGEVAFKHGGKSSRFRDDSHNISVRCWEFRVEKHKTLVALVSVRESNSPVEKHTGVNHSSIWTFSLEPATFWTVELKHYLFYILRWFVDLLICFAISPKKFTLAGNYIALSQLMRYLSLIILFSFSYLVFFFSLR